LPFALQEQLFIDISSRARRHAKEPSGQLLSMEEAICYLLGFGVKQDHGRCLSIMKECCLMGHLSAREMLPRVYDALGLPIPQDILPSPWLLKDQGSNSLVGFNFAKAIVGAQSSLHEDSPIHHAVMYGSVTDVEAMLASDPSAINQRNAAGDTPLIVACRSGNLSVIELLVEKVVDCSTTNNLAESALHWIWTFDCSSIPNLVSRMTQLGADPNSIAEEHPLSSAQWPYPLVGGTALHRAVAQGNKDAVQELLSNSASTSQAGGPIFVHKGRSRRCDPIQLACMWHETEILEVLLDSTPFYRINADSGGAVSLLYFAIQCQSTPQRMARYGTNFYFRMQKTIDLLMGRGCTKVVDSDGLTALQLAVISGSIDILEYLLTVDDFVKDINTVVGGKSALHWAIARGDSAQFELLLKHGADIVQPPVPGPTLEFAIKLASGNDYFIKRIFEMKPPITQTDKNHALAAAFIEGQYDIANFLLEHGANINGLTHTPELRQLNLTVFGRVLENRDAGAVIEILENLILLMKKHKQAPDFIVSHKMCETALHTVAGHLFLHDKYECTRLFALLLEMFPHKFHLEARNWKGWTPLHMAIFTRNAVAVRVLLDAGADVNSMALFEGAPVGPSAKDILFSQLFGREEYYDTDPSSRNKGDRALEQIFRVFQEPAVASRAKRSVTLRSQWRMSMTPRNRRVSNFVDVLSLLPESLPRCVGVPVMTGLLEALQIGQEDQFMRDSKLNPLTIARNVQWTELEGVRLLRQEGAEILERMGLLDAYVDE
jgi:ankyrin repeat protein